MFIVYFLKSEKDNGIYIGKTNKLTRRVTEHNSGQVPSTKSRRPLILLGYEHYQTEQEALEAEKKWKQGYKREQLKAKYGLR